MGVNRNISETESRLTAYIGQLSEKDAFDKKLESAKIIYQIAQVNVDRAFQEVSSKISGKTNIYKLFTAITRVAAMLSIPLLTFTLWTLFCPKNQAENIEIAEAQITWQEISSPVGMRSHIVLPDGTNLWLNAGSNLRYSIPFVRGTREVQLSGEAYLDVTKNEKSPFIVKTENSEVEVLGTKFNINAYPENAIIQMALKEGKIKFRFKDVSGSRKFIDLSPNDVMNYDKSNNKIYLIKATNIENYIAWHQNILILDETHMTELAKVLRQWYGVDVTIANEDIKRYKFTTTFNNEPLHRILELLEMSSPGISFRYIPGKPTEGGKNCSPSVVIITKNRRV